MMGAVNLYSKQQRIAFVLVSSLFIACNLIYVSGKWIMLLMTLCVMFVSFRLGFLERPYTLRNLK